MRSPHRRGVAKPLPGGRIGRSARSAAVGLTAAIFPLGTARGDLSGQQHDRPTGLSRHSVALDDLAATLINRNAHDLAMSRSTIWRILDEADLKPHRSVYWLNSDDPDFEAKAQEICKLYIKAPMMYQKGRLVICCDEKTGMQALGRPHPTQPAVPGKPERREQDYIRYGTRALIASFIVPTGELIGDLGPTRTSVDFATHLDHVAGQFPQIQGFDWVLDNLNTHWSLEVCRVIAQLCDVPFEAAVLQTGKQRRAFLTDPTHKHVFHFTPIHGSWLNQVELWFSVFGRRFLKRGDFASMADFEARLLRYVEDYNRCHAYPYRWTYTGTPLVRGTPFSQTRRQQRQGAPGLVHGLNSLNATFIRPGRISDRPRKLAKDLRNGHLAASPTTTSR